MIVCTEIYGRWVGFVFVSHHLLRLHLRHEKRGSLLIFINEANY